VKRRRIREGRRGLWKMDKGEMVERGEIYGRKRKIN